MRLGDVLAAAGPPGAWSLPLELDLVADRDRPASSGHELVVRAWDTAGRTQASTPDKVWNVKGYLGCAWHRIRVTTV